MSCYFCLLNLSCRECYVVPLYFVYCSVGVSVCLMCCLFDSEIAIMLLNVMAVLSVGGCALLDIPCMVFQRMCLLCL